MQAIHAENVNWKSHDRGVREAKIFSAVHGSEETRIDMVEVPAGAYIPAHRHSSRREFITILLSAGAQLQIGERVFRPIAGQVFHREPGDVLALTNDSQHPFRYSVVRFGYESSDIEFLQDVSAYEHDSFIDVEHTHINENAEIEEVRSEDSVEDFEATVEMDALEIDAVAEVSKEVDKPTPSKDSKSEKNPKSKTSKNPKATKPSKGSKGSKSKE